jgi:hypothetical protein
MPDDDTDDSEHPALDEADWNPDPATFNCPECDAEVSEDADRCPECAHYFSPLDARSGPSSWYKIAIAFLIGLLIWAIIAWR